MEKDFIKEVYDTDDTPGENAEDEELSFIEQQMLLAAQQRSIQEQLSGLIEEREQSTRMLASFERSAFHDDLSQFRTSPFECAISPVVSPLQESQISSEYTTENSSDSTNLTRGSEQPDIFSSDSIKDLTKHSEKISKNLQGLHEKVDYLMNLLPKSSDNETQTSGSLDSQSDFEITDENTGSRKYYFGKGKEAFNPKFRYNKGSRNVPSCGSSVKEADKPTHEYKEKSEKIILACSSLAKDSPCIRSEEASRKSDSKSPDHYSQKSKVQVKSIYPGMKRKGSDSNEKDLYRQHLDESGASTSGVLQLPGNLSDDDEDLKVPKKMKFDDGKKPSESCPTLAALLSNTNHERLDLEQFMKLDEWDKPSTSGLLNVGGSTPNSEEAYIGNRSDIVEFNERGGSPVRSAGSMSPGEKEDSFTSVSDISPSEREESSLTSVIEDTTQTCGSYFLQLIQSEDKSDKEKDETTDDEVSPSNTKL